MISNANLRTRRDAATPRGVSVMSDFFAARAENASCGTSRAAAKPSSRPTAPEQLGLILLSCGVYGNAIRFLYPLTIPQRIACADASQTQSGLTDAVP